MKLSTSNAEALNFISATTETRILCKNSLEVGLVPSIISPAVEKAADEFADALADGVLGGRSGGRGRLGLAQLGSALEHVLEEPIEAAGDRGKVLGGVGLLAVLLLAAHAEQREWVPAVVVIVAAAICEAGEQRRTQLQQWVLLRQPLRIRSRQHACQQICHLQE